MEMSMQTAKLHWQNNSTIDGAATMIMMAKQIKEYHQGTSRRELMDKVPLHCVPLRV